MTILLRTPNIRFPGTSYKYFRHICFSYRFDGVKVIDAIRLLAPDVVIFATSLVTLLSTRNTHAAIDDQFDDVDGISPSTATHTQSNGFYYVEDVLPVFVALMLLLAGITQPNLLSSIYFLTFLVLGICWAFHFSSHIQKSYTYFCLKVLLLMYSGLHILLLYLYQMSFMQKFVHPQELVPRFVAFCVFLSIPFLRLLDVHWVDDARITVTLYFFQ